jgi:SAM-dependent methyltransferase
MGARKGLDDVKPSDYRGLGAVYTDAWYDTCSDESLRAARIYVDHLWHFFQPTSVLDVGCGRGSWLTAWLEKGVRRAIGFDGEWNSVQQMIDPSISFKAVDLNQPFRLESGVDLTMSLEVAEHLRPQSAPVFVESLARTSDVILFSAAFPRQGGPGHLNEQRPTYWARLFGAHDFIPFDLLRPTFWSDDRIPFWYRQNSFIYVKKDTDSQRRLASHAVQPLAHTGFMDCVHPALYSDKVRALQRLAVLYSDKVRAVQNPAGG